MVLNGGIAAHVLRGFGQVLFGHIVLAHLEVGPAERVEIGSVCGIQVHGFLDERDGFVQLGSAIGKHITEIIQSGCILCVGGENLAELRFRVVVFFLPFVGRAAQEIYVFFVFVLGRELLGLIQRFFRFGPAFEAAIHLSQRDVNLAVFRRALQESLDLLQAAFRVAHIGELRSVYHFEAAIIRKLSRRFFRNVGRLLPLLGFTVGIDDLLVAALRIVVAQRNHFAEGVNGRLVVIVVAVNGSQPLQENSTIAFLASCIAGVGLLGFLQ